MTHDLINDMSVISNHHRFFRMTTSVLRKYITTDSLSRFITQIPTMLIRHPQIPIAIPKDMPEAQAKALVDYLKSNPEAAKSAHEQAQAMLRHPGVAQSVLSSAPGRQVHPLCCLPC